ncbi:MAG TPA: hypothetical protein DEB39_01820 [Planctomycetaceae bacterium]|nr:hypothetical protein [Planctomycetaceae bacterium]
MMYVATLSPLRIAMGKFWSGFVLSALFYSCTLPFMTLAFMLRGVDSGNALVLIACSFLLIQTFNVMCLGFLAGARSYLEAGLRTIPLLVLGLAVFYVFVWDFAREIYQGTMWRDLLMVFLMIAFFLYAVVPAGMLFLAACQFASPQSNRMFLTRVVMSVFGAVSLGAAFLMQLAWRDMDNALPIWVLFAMYPCFLLCFTACCERREYGLRLRAGIPRTTLGRLLAFPFYTGDCNAVVWLLLWILAGNAVYWTGTAIRQPPGYSWDWITIAPLISAVLLSFNYAVAAIAVRNVLRRCIPVGATWIILLGLLGIGIIVGMPLRFIDDPFNRILFAPNPIWILDIDDSHPEYKIAQLVFAGVWFALLVPVVAVWARRRFKMFVRYEPGEESTNAA